jgi:hypothetical protein
VQSFDAADFMRLTVRVPVAAAALSIYLRIRQTSTRAKKAFLASKHGSVGTGTKSFMRWRVGMAVILLGSCGKRLWKQ